MDYGWQAESDMSQVWKQWEGQVVNGEFPLREYLGGTEHSAVFLTEDRERGFEKAAIKLIPADPENKELQLHHWQATAKLSHPHLVRLFQMGRCRLGNSDLLYLVKEYADVDLSQILPRGPFSPEETRETLKRILDALAFLHSNGFVHGHLKPANILSVDGQLKLSSDGIFRVGHSRVGGATPGDYDPPEAASGIYSPAGDVWSLGMILVETLPDRPPVWVTTEEGDPVLPPTLPEPFFDIARNCLRWEPRRRLTVPEILERLEPTVPEPKAQSVFANWRYIAAAGAVALALAAILAGPKLMDHHHAQPVAEQNPVTLPAEPPAKKPSAGQQSSKAVRPPLPAPRPATAAEAPTGNVVQSGVRQKVLPNVPQSARDTIKGTIRVTVKVTVDPSGNVAEATLDSPGPSQYFARLALEAARKWKFSPAESDGQNVSKEWTLQFEFTSTGTDAAPVQTAP
jgi:TonB family protein